MQVTERTFGLEVPMEKVIEQTFPLEVTVEPVIELTFPLEVIVEQVTAYIYTRGHCGAGPWAYLYTKDEVQVIELTFTLYRCCKTFWNAMAKQRRSVNNMNYNSSPLAYWANWLGDEFDNSMQCNIILEMLLDFNHHLLDSLNAHSDMSSNPCLRINKLAHLDYSWLFHSIEYSS